MKKKSIATIFFDHVIRDRLEYGGRNDGTIWVCGPTNTTTELPSPEKKESPKPNEQLIDALIKYSRLYVLGDKQGWNTDQMVANQGRAFFPVRQSGLPLITKVKPENLIRKVAALSDNKGFGGVYICYGHGFHGLSMGMGSGKPMTQLMYGEEPDIGLSNFAIC